MGKILGIVLVLLGLALIALPLVLKDKISEIPAIATLLEKIPKTWIIIAGFVVLVVGALFLRASGKAKQSGEEVPIYEGEGRRRKIVGYKREK